MSDMDDGAFDQFSKASSGALGGIPGGDALGDTSQMTGDFSNLSGVSPSVPNIGSSIGSLGDMSGLSLGGNSTPNFSAASSIPSGPAIGNSQGMFDSMPGVNAPGSTPVNGQPNSFMQGLQRMFAGPKGVVGTVPGAAGASSGFLNSPGGQLLSGGSKMLGSLLDSNSQQAMQKAYGNNVQTLQNLYSPNSPYAQQMAQTLARRDAATGRNSQYGARAQQLAANLTQNQASTLSNPSYIQQLGASNAQISPLAGMLGAAPQLLQGIGGLSKLFGS